MSTKKQHLYNMAWWKLCELHERSVCGSTAGEFAKLMGIARSTAKRWLDEMTEQGGCEKAKGYGRNRLEATWYIPVGFDAYRHQQKYIREA